MHCFCQSERRPSVPMGKVLNGPDERERFLSSNLTPHLFRPGFHGSATYFCVYLCYVCYRLQLLNLSFSATANGKQC